MSLILHLVFLLGLYALLASALNLAVGYGGMLMLCHASFFATGAYGLALFQSRGGLPFEAALVAAILVGALLGLSCGWLFSRLRGEAFVLSTLAVQVAFHALLQNWEGLTGGTFGLGGISRPRLFGSPVESPMGLAGLSLGTSLVVASGLFRLSRSPYGRILQAVRDDADAAEAAGRDPLVYRRSAIVASAALAALAGALYASYTGYIDPASFELGESVFVLSAVIVGGAATIRGPLVGAFILVFLPEVLRHLPLPAGAGPNLRQVLLAAILVFVLLRRPQGLLGRYALD